MKGFTIIEMLLTLAVISVIVALSAPVYQSFQVRNDLDIAVNTISQSFYRAQVQSQSVASDTTWGLNIHSGGITIFQGENYDKRVEAFDETFDLPTSITPSGLTEVVFNKLSGWPMSTGTVILNSSTNETRSIKINPKGMVDY